VVQSRPADLPALRGRFISEWISQWIYAQPVLRARPGGGRPGCFLELLVFLQATLNGKYKNRP
jgi:hypothetical protein